MKFGFSLVCCFWLNGFVSVHAQIPQLQLPEATQEVRNLISFSLPEGMLNQVHAAKGEMLDFKVSFIIVNSDTLKAEHIRIRGNTSSYLRRKSFNIKLIKKASFIESNDTFRLKKFYAISLSMDRNYIRNRLSCAILKDQHVLVPRNCYTNLTINGRTEGIYLIFYPPDEYGLQSKNASVVLRRGYGASVDDVDFKGISKEESSVLIQKFLSIYKVIIKKYQGEKLFQELENVLDLDGYFTWLAFNHLFQNGDYADEAYFMWSPKKNKFQAIPWDFDDILKSEPHEGLKERNKVLRDQLIFSSEDALDVAIANDPFVYRKYLTVYKKFIESLTPEALGNVLTKVYSEVLPYYKQPDIIGQSQFDMYGITEADKLEADLRNIYQSVNAKAINIGKEIDALLEK